MLSDHYTSTVTISRKTVTGNKTTFAEAGSIACHIQPLSPTYQNGEWGRLQKEYRMFSDGEVRIGDKLVDNAGLHYEVFGVVAHKFRIGSRHYEANLRGI
jgi:hypothetical protein